jgi:SAM-dependent methyltransferase
LRFRRSFVTVPGTVSIEPQTWHYGLVADWWALFNVGGPEIDYYGAFVGRGQPALDAGCGAGRLLVPWLKAGYDVDGCDVSPDMIERCRDQARREGFEPTLLAQPLHALDPPRRYRTIVACGVFGLGSTRAQDEEALRRLHDALEPDGTLLLDHEVPYGSSMRWSRWPSDQRGVFPEPWPEESMHREADDGSRYDLRSRALSVDPLDQSVVLELRVEKSYDAAVIAVEEHTLTMRGYFRDELLLLLERAGFADVEVRADYGDEPPTADSKTLVFVARRGS